jgi:AbrB family looped-hinge helix DNA binding protein
MEIIRIGKRGTIVLPAALRRQFGLEEGSVVLAEIRDEGIVLCPAIVVPADSQQRRAEILFSTAANEKDYSRAQKEVRRMGIDPAKIRHRKPKS